MKLEKIYYKDINREVNPAVNASNLSDETVHIEIDEYVFTDDIIKNLYQVLVALKDRNLSHNGMWISGYFGSGKSHFLKFVKYCLDPKYSERAVNRLVQAVKERDPLTVPESKTDVTIDDMNNLAIWLKAVKVETILFNIGSVHNVQGNNRRVFLDVFWNEFNQMRGYNKHNLALAQYFEKVLDEKGKLEEFKQCIDEMGFDWETDCISLATTELDLVLEKGKELVPSLSTDIIREKIIKEETTLSVETFVAELKAYVNKQGDNYRLIFLADEISQFIDNRPGLLLQLQQIVSDIHLPCDDKVWVACTAQQDLSEIVSSCNINQTSEDYGKIMGRFQVKISLGGTSTEYITQKRILEKSPEAAVTLGNLYAKKKNAIDAQFNLPAGYKIFANADDFVNYYPFVPYQFTLMGNVFDNFVTLGFVNREVKGNERSIIKVTHSTAQDTKEQEVGDFIAFDQFYNAMFSQGLSARGRNTVAPAEAVAREYSDPDFAIRVVHVLFMLCYMSEAHRQIFAATAENITTLTMRDIDCKKLTLKNDVQSVLDFLVTNNIVRKETQRTMEVYSFYSEDEREVASTIKNQSIDTDSRATVVQKIINDYLTLRNRESFASTSVNIGATIMGKASLSGNPDVRVEFVFDNNFGDVHQFALQNAPEKLVFYMADLFAGSGDLKNNFHWYCQVNKYLQIPSQSEARTRTNNEFRAQAADMFRSNIEPKFREMFDKCVIISGNQVVDSITQKGKDRYAAALNKHLSDMYYHAELVNNPKFPTTGDALKAAIMRPVQPGEYTELNPLSEAEKQVKNYIDRQGIDVVLSDVAAQFQKRPYGWNEYSLIYVVNELVRRRIYEFAYNNNTDVNKTVIASNIAREKNKFTIKPARVIPVDVINRFSAAWKDIFSTMTVPGGTDPADIFSKCRDTISDKVNNDTELMAQVAAYPFAEVLKNVIAKLNEWLAEREQLRFFEKVAADLQVGKELVDKSKEIREFCNDQLTNYKQCVAFAQDNKDNWNDVDDEAQDAAKKFAEILKDEWPVGKMPQYLRMRKMLEAKLGEVKETLRQTIERRYKETEQQLIGFAAEQGVKDYHSNVDAEIILKKRSDSIAVLKLNCNTDDYYSAQAAKILKMVPHEPVPGGEPEGGNPPTPTPRVKNVRLNTRSTSALVSAQDVDDYLNKLRSQLMAHIDNGEKIIIL